MDLDVLKNELLRKKRERRRREFLIHFRSLTADSHGLSKMRRHRITVVHEAKKSSFVLHPFVHHLRTIEFKKLKNSKGLPRLFSPSSLVPLTRTRVSIRADKHSESNLE